MKLLAISDLHIGKQGWGGFGDQVLLKAQELAKEVPVDAVVFCGDLVDPDAAPLLQDRVLLLQDALQRLKHIKAREHLWVLGNNDLACLMTPTSPLSQMSALFFGVGAHYGVHVLDWVPRILDDVAFVGNFGAFDCSLWRPSQIYSPHHPPTKEEVLRTTFPKELTIGADLGCQEHFAIRQATLHDHIREVEQTYPDKKLVVVTHTVPTPEFVVYGATPAYDHQNAWMGWDDNMSSRPIHTVPSLVLQLCGHTHRSGRLDRSAPLVNVSGQDQPHIFDI